jgi:hypothetical protein
LTISATGPGRPPLRATAPATDLLGSEPACHARRGAGETVRALSDERRVPRTSTRVRSQWCSGNARTSGGTHCARSPGRRAKFEKPSWRKKTAAFQMAARLGLGESGPPPRSHTRASNSGGTDGTSLRAAARVAPRVSRVARSSSRRSTRSVIPHVVLDLPAGAVEEEPQLDDPAVGPPGAWPRSPHPGGHRAGRRVTHRGCAEDRSVRPRDSHSSSETERSPAGPLAFVHGLVERKSG